MNTRILRMCRRERRGHACYHVPALGQLQPVLFAWDRGRLTFRAEDVVERDGTLVSCISRHSLPRDKTEAKALFAALEQHRREGTETPAARSWREYQEQRQTPPPASPTPAPSGLDRLKFDLFGNPI
ncbi:hypothetical protein [Pannonibacter tanglangensis]|uniref:Uncharacterized protein n=1 Tax=Pannonibacter tanglangensis TaxID=2750084 RepID=A0ABW9ZE12_9HYPH|nr:hypothetical protein [Pannonibacter sp. XCT-34]NBN63085.1 hypothetical protein [Pannonibacter sp. XCT-34]